jgi:hypothetical protein
MNDWIGKTPEGLYIDQIVISFELPETKINLDIGYFMVTMEIIKNNTPIFISHRTVLL